MPIGHTAHHQTVLGQRTRTLLTSQIEAMDMRLTELDVGIGEADTAVEGLREREQQLSIDIASNGGDRLAVIEAELATLADRRHERQRALERFNALLTRVGLDGSGRSQTRCGSRRRHLT